MAATEIAGGVFGLLGSIVLANPALMDLNNRRFRDQLHRLKAIKGASNRDVEALGRLLQDDLLGGHRLHARCAVGGGLARGGVSVLGRCGNGAVDRWIAEATRGLSPDATIGASRGHRWHSGRPRTLVVTERTRPT